MSKPRYDAEALRNNIERLDKEIELFQAEIQKHTEQKAELQVYLKEIEEERRRKGIE
jgi:predicted  nucleic acid-binding Zn-ribbon protein